MTPLPPGSFADVALSGLLAWSVTSAPFLLQAQGPGSFLSILGGGWGAIFAPNSFLAARGPRALRRARDWLTSSRFV